MQKILLFVSLTVVLMFTGCLSTKKELTTSEKGKTYYVSEAECPLYELMEDDSVKCFDEEGKFLMTLKPLNDKDVERVRHQMVMDRLDAIERRQRYNNQLRDIEFYYYDYY